MHFLRNALDHMPRKVNDDCLRELRWLDNRRDLSEAKRDLTTSLAKWAGDRSQALLLGEGAHRRTLTFYPLPPQHHNHLKSTNLLECLNEEIKRRTYIVRLFLDAESCLRLIRAHLRQPS